jgi:hypothetical protein
MMFFRVFAGCGLVMGGLLAAPAVAQLDDGFALEAANRAGLLERCSKQGLAKQQDINDALAVLHNRPQLPAAERLKAATDEGLNGVVLAADQYIPLDKLARDQGRSIADMCGIIAASANMAASMIEKS